MSRAAVRVQLPGREGTPVGETNHVTALVS
jgi:hypothetical protein